MQGSSQVTVSEDDKCAGMPSGDVSKVSALSDSLSLKYFMTSSSFQHSRQMVKCRNLFCMKLWETNLGNPKMPYFPQDSFLAYV